MVLSLACAAAVGCGPGESGITDPEPSPETPPSPNYVRLESDAGDFIGGGKTYAYTQENAEIIVSENRGHLRIRLRGDEEWFGDFQAPNASTQFQPGEYHNLTRWGFHDPATGGLSWIGEGRTCNTVTGHLEVDSVTYDNGKLVAIALSFEQLCESSAAALRGAIHWRSDDPTRPPEPVNPAPGGLWRPEPGATPAAGNFVYLKSDAGDYVGAGQTHVYTEANSVIAVSANGGRLTIEVNGAQAWSGDFQTMNTITRLDPGYYADLHRPPFHNPVKGGLSWDGQGRRCTTSVGLLA